MHEQIETHNFLFTQKCTNFVRHMIAGTSRKVTSTILVGIIVRNDFRDTCNQKNEVLIGGSKVTVKPDYRLVFNKRQHEFYYWLTARETNDSCIRRPLL